MYIYIYTAWGTGSPKPLHIWLTACTIDASQGSKGQRCTIQYRPTKEKCYAATTGSSKHVTSMDIANMHARHVRKSGCRHESSKTFLVCHADLVYVCAKSIDACHVRQVSKHQHPSAQVSYPIPAFKFGQVFSTKTPDHVGDHSEKCSDSLKVCNLIF